jgi:hypothetical protein
MVTVCRWTDNVLYESLDSAQWEHLKLSSQPPKCEPDKTLYIVERMMDMWADSIKPCRVYKPGISCQELISELLDYVPDCALHADLILARIVRLNVILGEMSTNELFGSAEYNENAYKKAHQKLFYLNLDSRFPPKRWARIVTVENWKKM